MCELCTFSQIRSHIWNLLEEEIAYYQDKGHTLLLGDFNARTASNFDYIELDSNNYVPLPDNYIPDNPLPRVPQDTILNNYGKSSFMYWLWTSCCKW